MFFFSPFSIVITSLGEEVYVLLMHLFVYFARANFCPFFLHLGVGLRLVIVALPGLFFELFCMVLSSVALGLVTLCRKSIAVPSCRLCSYCSHRKCDLIHDYHQHKTAVKSIPKQVNEITFYLNIQYKIIGNLKVRKCLDISQGIYCI